MLEKFTKPISAMSARAYTKLVKLAIFDLLWQTCQVCTQKDKIGRPKKPTASLEIKMRFQIKISIFVMEKGNIRFLFSNK